MISFFRRLINSKAGIVVTFIALGVIALAFALSDVTGLRHSSAGLADSTVASVGGDQVTATELRNRTQNELEGFRQQRPDLDIAQYIEGGGFDATLDRLINALALYRFGQSAGMVVSKKAIDGQIASIPALQGPDGKFSDALFRRVLSERRLTADQIRLDIARDTIGQQLTAPVVGASQVPAQLALPYASLLLEKRAGSVGIVPISVAGAGAQPTDTEIADFYQRNKGRYVVAERRTIRYALVSADEVKARVVAGEAELRQAYQQQSARFAATEKRSLRQVVIGDKGAADALAAKVKAGTAIDVAARATGLEAAKIEGIEQTAYAGQTTPDIARAVFVAAKGAVVGPVKAPLGWIVAQIDSVQQVGAKSFDQARAELTQALIADKAQRALAETHDKIDDALSDHATFAEVVGDQKLPATVSPPLFADGRNANDPAKSVDPRFQQLVAAGFAAEQGDDPQLVPVGQDGSFAVVALDGIVAAAAPPASAIRDALVKDFVVDRARRASRKIAADIVARVNRGTPLAQAIAQSGVKLPPIEPLASSRAEVAAQTGKVPPALALMFSMAPGSAKLLEAPKDAGWFVVRLDSIERHDAGSNKAVVAAMQGEIGRQIGAEYVQQFVEGIRRQVGVKKNAEAIARVRAELLGQAPAKP